jgi:hypothetical protein
MVIKVFSSAARMRLQRQADSNLAGRYQRLRSYWQNCLPQCVSSIPTSPALSRSYLLTLVYSIEHNEVDIVAVNDPFIDPTYAVRPPEWHPNTNCSTRD